MPGEIARCAFQAVNHRDHRSHLCSGLASNFHGLEEGAYYDSSPEIRFERPEDAVFLERAWEDIRRLLAEVQRLRRSGS